MYVVWCWAHTPCTGLIIRHTLLIFARSFSAWRLGLIPQTMASLPCGHHLLITIWSVTCLKDRVTEQVRCCSAACRSAALGLHFFRALHRKEPCSFPSCWLSVPATTSPSESMTALHTLLCIDIDSHAAPHWVFCRRLKSDPHCDHVLV